jgi:hypothetical protein
VATSFFDLVRTGAAPFDAPGFAAEELTELVHAALDLLPPTNERERAQLSIRLASALHELNRPEEAVARCMEALAISEREGLARYETEQPPYNLLDRRIENELLPLCRKYGLGVLPWSPLGGGILAGRYNDGIPEDSRATRRPQVKDRITDRGLDVVRELGKLAADRGLTLSQLALLWCKDQDGVTAPIIGPRTMEQLDDALGVLDATLDDETRATCDELVHPGNAVADFFNTSGWMTGSVEK